MRRRPLDPTTSAYFLIGGLVAAAIGGLWVTRQVSAWLVTGDWLRGPAAAPATMVGDLFAGRMQWSGLQQTVGISYAVLLVAALLSAMYWSNRRANRHKTLRGKAAKLGTGKDMSYRAARDKAKAGKLVGKGVEPGLLLARTMAGRQEIYSAWREGVVVIMGPGGRKTTGLATPLILSAPGAVFATSNKRDVADQIRATRETVGRFWCFDLQGIANYLTGPLPDWWWNILTYVRDETRALELASMFASTAKSGKKPGGSDSDFFEEAGKHLLARLLHAAAISGRHVDQVFLWLSDEKEREPVALLEAAGYRLPAAGLQHTYNSPPEQRGGVFATARGFVEFLENKQALAWITPLGPDDRRPQFDPERFVRSAHDTLVMLSKEGNGSMGPVTSALTKAVLDSAEEYAQDCGGRVEVPLLGMLDEAANCAKISDLPDKYSFYGGMGIHPVTILQSPNQGIAVWGETGWKKLWDSATIRMVGNGVKDMNFLRDLAAQGGPEDIVRWNVSSGRGRSGYSTTSNTTREDILSPADLANMSPGDVYIVHNNGSAPVLARVVPYWERGKQMAAAVEASKSLYHPGKNKAGAAA